MNDTRHANHLGNETSPYLLQHAHNPVDWHPWGSEALEKARSQNKPILLSIGYSACHWCHVMAHESFEDEETAAVMNQLFINIKVDREERPDIDKIYQTAYQLLNGRAGGWPLTMFLTPDDHVPFFGATYLPKEPRYGMPSFTDLMQRLINFYHNREEDVRQQNVSLMQALQAGASQVARTGYALNTQPLQDIIEQLTQAFDAIHGGFGKAPKFPHPTNIERLLRYWRHSDQDESGAKTKEIACFTLTKMAQGGLYDHLGGGFCRYSVDDQWMIPHFEKMLYDNGPLLTLYSEAWQATGDPLFKSVAEETAAWVMREMQSPDGGFYSTLDADSEGEEGKFYIWTRDQIKALLTPEEYAVFAPRFGLDSAPNFEGHWHLNAFKTPTQAAEQAGITIAHTEKLLIDARNKLFAERERRIRPGRDEKILCAWNALMIKGMAAAGRHLNRPDLLQSAENALDFVQNHLWRNGRLLVSYKDGEARLPAYLDDYAFLIDAILELLQGRWRDNDLNFAIALADVLLEHFQDTSKKGGFFFTADDHERLIQRPKPLYDDALPCGNGIAAQVMIKLGHLLNSLPHLVAAERTLKWAWPSMERNPMACSALLLALEEYYHPSETIVIRGPKTELEDWRRHCAQPYAPRRLTLAIPADATNLPEFLSVKAAEEDVVAYICQRTQCSAPVKRLADLDTALATS